MVHHENEKERTSLLGGFVLVVGLTNLHPQVIRDILLEVVIGELEVLLKPGNREPFTIPEAGSSNILNRNLGNFGVEIQSKPDGLSGRIGGNNGENVVHVKGAVLTLHFADEDL